MTDRLHIYNINVNTVLLFIWILWWNTGKTKLKLVKSYNKVPTMDNHNWCLHRLRNLCVSSVFPIPSYRVIMPSRYLVLFYFKWLFIYLLYLISNVDQILYLNWLINSIFRGHNCSIVWYELTSLKMGSSGKLVFYFVF